MPVESPAKTRKSSGAQQSPSKPTKTLLETETITRGRKAKKTTYVNLDSDMEDSEDDFKPNDDEEEEEDDFEAEVSDDGEEPVLLEEGDEEVLLQEVKPKPKNSKRKRSVTPSSTELEPSKSTVAPTGAAFDGNAADILSQIEDAELPESLENDGKLNYFALKNKQLNLAPPSGSLELPEAAPNCLTGLTIVFTGVLPNLDRDAAESVAKRYGAKVTKSILKKTSLVVIGEEAGPSKVKKIKDFKIKAVTENGFVDLLLKMPADGGNGSNAQAAKRKREEEEEAIIAEAEAQEKAEQKKEHERKMAAKKAARDLKKETGPSVTAAPEPRREIPSSEKLWTVKYAPSSISQLCGNKGQVQKLKNWLANWFDNAKKDFKSKGSDGSGLFRAALISGPPGIGKTSAAHLVANELGFDILEKNASDVRSKSLLNSTIKSVLNNTSVVGFFKSRDDAQRNENDRKFCLIMDEVDGMSSGDHGGAGALSAFCRITKMPIILICNDKSLPKMRTFDRVTLDLPFKRPSEMEMKSRLMTIAFREKLKLDPTVIGQLVQATGNDIRQIINLMSTVSKTQKTINHENSKEIAESWKKHAMLKPFAIVLKFLGGGIFNSASNHTLNDKIEMYFNDIDFTPLMIQENYISLVPEVRSATQHLERVAAAADAISQSDHVNSLIRSSEQQWSLLPFHAVMSTVIPAKEVHGKMGSFPSFTSWLGQNSKTLKYSRMLQELQYHTRMRTSTSKNELRLDYVPAFALRLSAPLIDSGEDGIEEVVAYMDNYYLTKEDWDNLIDFGVGANKGANILSQIPTKVKSAFTRKYNGASHPVAIIKTGNSVVGSGAKQKADFEGVVEDDTVNDEEEQEARDDGTLDLKKDKFIKAVKPKKTATKAAKTTTAKKPAAKKRKTAK